MDVRPARIEDAEQWCELLRAVAQEGRWIGTEMPFDQPARVIRLREQLSGGSLAGWALEDDGGLVGTLALEFIERNPGFASLGMMLAAPSRGRGGGSALLDAALSWARESDLRKIGLEVWTDNTSAIALYARAGFEVEGLRRDHYRRRDGSLRSTLIMSIFV